MAGEASSSRPKRQQVPSIAQSVIPDGGEEDAVEVKRSGTLFELDLLDCPICCVTLTSRIFQCDNGHVACPSCCEKMKKKCSACTLPIGKYRCRRMERVVEAVIVSNVKHGYTAVVKKKIQSFSGEVSSSGRRRQRVPLVFEEECETGGAGDLVVRPGKLFELDLLDCPVCCDALTDHIFQCDNGHIACSSCCTKLRHICPSCSLPIGINRCRIMEKVVKAIIFPCPNAKHGCTETISYGKELAHKKKCSFVLCYCPALNCNYSGVYKNLYSHYAANHKDTDKRFRYGYSHHVYLDIETKISVLQEYADGPLVVVQCFKEPQGMYFTVNCIAPPSPGVGKFSYDISYSTAGNTMTFTSSKMNKLQEVSFQTPKKDFMLVPDYLFDPRFLVKHMRICIRSLEEEEDEEEEDYDDEDED